MISTTRRTRRAIRCAIESLEQRTLLAASTALNAGLAAGSSRGSLVGTGKTGGANPPAVITLGVWPTYTQASADLATLANTYPSITKLVNIGSTIQGRTIWAMEITDNPGIQEDEPEFYYQGQIHGDEPIGMENSFQLMSEMLDNYGGTSAQAVRETNLINNMDLWFVPSINWDGYNASSPSVGHRGNANNVDLNRNFPEWTTRSFSNDTKLFGVYGNVYDGPTPNTTGLQPETIATMNFLKAHHFVASANFHSGDLVVNYPWDTDSSVGANYAVSPDDALFKQMALAYSTTNLPMYNNNSAPFVHGTTNGDNWYPISGGEQDWANLYTGDHQFTIELDNVQKYPPASQLTTYWNNNHESMLQYMETANWGVRGVVSDVDAGRAAVCQGDGDRTAASPTPDSHHPASVPVFTDPAVGDYHRQLLPGTYTMKFEATGYQTQLVTFTTGPNSNDPTLTFRQDVQMLPLDAVPPTVQAGSFAYNGSPQAISFAFSEQVLGVDSTDLILHDNASNTNIPSTSIVLDNYDGTAHVATFRFSYPGGTLPAGSYTASLNPDGITDTSGNKLAPGYAYNFIYAAGSESNDTVYARRNGALLQVWQNSDPSTDPAQFTATYSTLANFDIDGFGGNDQLTLDFANGEVRPAGAGGFGYRLGGQNESLVLSGVTNWNFATDPSLDRDNANLALSLRNGAVATFSAAVTHLRALDVQSGASAALVAGAGRVLVVNAVTVNGATLDLNDNDMIVDYDTTAPLADVVSNIRTGRHGGAWDGLGIISTAARNANPKVTGLGAIEAWQYLSSRPPGALFDDQPIDNTAVLVKYTYYGDADFNGKVDGADYAHIDVAFNQEHSVGNIGGWFNGDFNYDDKIDGADYGNIDASFNAQSTVL